MPRSYASRRQAGRGSALRRPEPCVRRLLSRARPDTRRGAERNYLEPQPAHPWNVQPRRSAREPSPTHASAMAGIDGESAKRNDADTRRIPQALRDIGPDGFIAQESGTGAGADASYGIARDLPSLTVASAHGQFARGGRRFQTLPRRRRGIHGQHQRAEHAGPVAEARGRRRSDRPAVEAFAAIDVASEPVAQARTNEGQQAPPDS